MICWSAVWIDPKEIESRLTITIVCLLSLIAYNFVIDSDMPKLEYLTIMDYIILISYIYAAIPNFLSIYSFQLIKKNKALAEKHEAYEKKYGLPSYILIIFIIIIVIQLRLLNIPIQCFVGQQCEINCLFFFGFYSLFFHQY